mmetsp:Transcript_1461/g.2434  ORF Transcript_1461/g.2434 Transcript_1461/m.2434 type:complete len:420 (-) Transcript_1461:75-1334(-)|eukprot:CAMPEP_0184700910 /NCGR_PEP_ID=MMETSP0313-20130426/16791_1 /TAXON_ID=2792 /ORGANISM="Porphyridium aerugineum, Strain SAG 1380-2" /LENGTH=419 /DNA_ID=CAMNT_0027160763 /DNA_START=122 /DNA_END=1381 /DNA_ORIENTATION=-
MEPGRNPKPAGSGTPVPVKIGGDKEDQQGTKKRALNPQASNANDAASPTPSQQTPAAAKPTHSTLQTPDAKLHTSGAPTQPASVVKAAQSNQQTPIVKPSPAPAQQSPLTEAMASSVRQVVAGNTPPSHPYWREALDNSSTKDDELDEDDEYAFAKIIGVNFVYYMKNLEVTIGRSKLKPSDPKPETIVADPEQPDIGFRGEKAISRIHARIAYSPIEHAFELHVLGRNPVYVNGIAYTQGGRPARLTSQSDVALVRRYDQWMKQNPKGAAVFTFLLPSASVNADSKLKKRPPVLLKGNSKTFDDFVGEAIVMSHGSIASLDEICQYIESRYPAVMSTISNSDVVILRNQVRHVLITNPVYRITRLLGDSGVFVAKYRIDPSQQYRYAVSAAANPENVQAMKRSLDVGESSKKSPVSIV